MWLSSTTCLRERLEAEQGQLSARDRLTAEEARQEERTEAGLEVQRLSGLRERVEKIVLAGTELEHVEKQHQQEAAECGRLESEVQRLTEAVASRDEQIMALRTSGQRAEFLSLQEQKLDSALQSRRRLDQVNADLGAAKHHFEKLKRRSTRRTTPCRKHGVRLTDVHSGKLIWAGLRHRGRGYGNVC